MCREMWRELRAAAALKGLGMLFMTIITIIVTSVLAWASLGCRQAGSYCRHKNATLHLKSHFIAALLVGDEDCFQKEKDHNAEPPASLSVT
jgi:hypothetical protein